MSNLQVVVHILYGRNFFLSNIKSGNYDLCHEQNDEAAFDELVEAVFSAGHQKGLFNIAYKTHMIRV